MDNEQSTPLTERLREIEQKVAEGLRDRAPSAFVYRDDVRWLIAALSASEAAREKAEKAHKHDENLWRVQFERAEAAESALLSERQRQEQTTAALVELIRLKNLKDEISRLQDGGDWPEQNRAVELNAEYRRDQPRAWYFARRALAVGRESLDTTKDQK